MDTRAVPCLLISALLLSSSSMSAEARRAQLGVPTQQDHPASSARQLKAKGAGGELTDLMIQVAQAISSTIQEQSG
ncbi:hypothetical protein CVIRNUC_004195 [Coccomyxa viridis]|uniref:Uncharacterized protein n=1 Tax=Coccomyxa viridis TaxID=1274662 RepID=A0AAV1I3R8_9CHLO|nr:hypothetical protein CVIRNUC_004195 [Coccomyxa viridis]